MTTEIHNIFACKQAPTEGSEINDALVGAALAAKGGFGGHRDSQHIRLQASAYK